MKKITIAFLLLVCLQAFSQDVYDTSTIQTIEIVFAQANWDALLDAEKAADNNYTEAQSVTINGTVFNQVGVKYKGNSSYNANQTKNPFHIELDTYVDQNYGGVTDLKLSNVIFDPTFVRETVSYAIVSQYMHTPQSNYANVYVNGNLMGLYTNVESISKKFVNNHFGSNDNAFFSCSPPAGAGPGSNDYPNLVYLGTNSTSYDDAYEIKSDDETDPAVAVAHWDDLIELTDVLNNNIANIETVLDVDRAIWMLAFDNVMVNLDSYIGQFKQNYYLYKGDNGRFSAVVWDLNMSFGTFGMTGEPGGGGPGGPGGGLSTADKQQLDHLLHDTDTNFPLMSKLLAVPTYKKMYLAHYKTILTENITNNAYLTMANDFQALVDAAVQADANKFYTYAQFSSNINSDVNLGMNTAPGLTSLMNGRGTYLSALTDFTVTQPTISNVTPSNVSPQIGTTISITSDVINTNTNAVFLGYRSDQHDAFVKVLMYDDGAHNDGAANDGVYGVDLTLTEEYTQYYIYAENNNIGAFSPARAEHEFYTINATYVTLTPGDLVINEIMASNVATVADQDGEYDDWLELYNNSSQTLSLDNLYLSDDPTDLLAWQFPTGLTIAPDSYLIVWCDKDLDQTGLHADLKFSSGGESAILSYANGTIIEDITFSAQTDDLGYARNPNGTGNFVIQAPTFNANNDVTPITTIPVGDLVINEIMASNVATAADQDGEYDDWLELYNNSSQTLSLDNLFLSDDPTDLLAWQFPTGLTIASDSYLIVWCDKDLDQTGLHADLKFSSGGESAILSYSDGTIIEDITFGAQTDDMGYARVPNGTGNFVIQTPTFNTNNESLSVDEFSLESNLKVYPNPTNGIVTIKNSSIVIEKVAIYNTLGQLLLESNYNNSNQIELDFSTYSKGVYMININNTTTIKIVRN